MGVLEIVLLVAGAGIFTLSFLLPKKSEEVSKETKNLVKDEITTMVSKELEGIKGHVDDVVGEAVEYAVEKTERSLDRLTNEKIMAVNEYSDTVLKEIHKNHEEAVFLYDMLNSKHNNIKDTVSKVDKTVKEAEVATREAEAAVNSFQKLLPNEAVDAVVVVPEPAQPVEEDPMEMAGNLLLAEMFGSKAETKGAGRKEQKTANSAGAPKSEHTGLNKNDRILELYKQGKSQVAIAQELSLGVGEVKLVIDLYKNV